MLKKINIKTYLTQYILILILVTFLACSKENASESIIEENETETPFIISAADLSLLPKIEATNTIYYNLNGEAEDVLTTLKNNGVNTIRLRIWKNPITQNSSFTEVKTFAEKIHSKNLKVWLTVHYSDTWADPGHQETPAKWQGITFAALKDSVYTYTNKITALIKPDYIQIGNEINGGFLFPLGKISNENQFLELLSTGSKAVRDASTKSKIILHYAGLDGASTFFNKTALIDYDIIGLSYYPIWHGKNLDLVQTTVTNLSNTYTKNVVIAETAYPFTLNWNDWTNNIIGLESQLILPDYPATPTGQKDFIKKIKTIITNAEKGIGFCYWGGELVAFDGPESTNGSPFENLALYDFNNKALPVITEFNTSN